ncbi:MULTISPECIES: hypothetical protein [unclassified Cedecea]|uniref:hypothetical protein n=1 Tax=unclassified Cedecea TaxID=2649846 RepID=UPI003015A099
MAVNRTLLPTAPSLAASGKKINSLAVSADPAAFPLLDLIIFYTEVFFLHNSGLAHRTPLELCERKFCFKPR